MASAHETLELGIIPTGDTEMAEDNMNEATPMNTPAVNGHDSQPVVPEDIQPDSNPTNPLHSEQGNMIFCIDLLYICCLKFPANSRALKRKSLFHFSLCYRHQHSNRRNGH